MIVDLADIVEQTADYDDVPTGYLARAADAATSSFASVEYDDEGRPLSFTACAELDAVDAQPPGWWIVLSYTIARDRGIGVGTRVLQEAFDTLAPTWPVFVREGRGRDLPWSAQFGYRVAPDQNWRLLDMRPRGSRRLYDHP